MKTASEIVELLAQKHANDVFVPNCKTGSSGGYGLKILDAWVMKRGWANPLVIGYEIKVNRSDFLNDNKWRDYLIYCNEFYFVTLKGLIQPNELPEEIGLLWISGGSSRFHTKKKAVYRDIKIDENVFRYVLMHRATIGGEYIYDKLDYWKKWIADKDEKSYIGQIVNEKLRKTYSTLMFENEQVKREIEQYSEIVAFLKDNDICLSNWTDGVCRDIKSKIDELESGFSSEFQSDLNKAIESLGKLKSHIEV